MSTFDWYCSWILYADDAVQDVDLSSRYKPPGNVCSTREPSAIAFASKEDKAGKYLDLCIVG